MAGRETYDVDPIQKTILEHRAARRQMLRQEYLKQIGNPYRMMVQRGALEDAALERHAAMSLTATEFFRPTTKNSIYIFIASVIPVGLTMYMIKTLKDRQEHDIRTGKISYYDRDYKFK